MSARLMRAAALALALLLPALPASAATLNGCFIGDSITAGNGGDPVSEAASKLAALGNTAANTNRGISGSSSVDWAPNSGTGYLVAAISACKAAGTTYTHIMLGTNDARTPNSLSAAAHTTNMTAIVNTIKAAGGLTPIIISKPLWTAPNAGSNTTVWPADSAPFYRGYFAADMALADGVSVFQGDTAAYALSFLTPSLLSDGIHPNASFNLTLGDLWAVALVQRFGTPATVVAVPGYRGGFTVANPGYTAAPSAVAGLSAAGQTSTSLTLSWTEPGAAATSRTITYRLAGSGSYAAIPGGTPSSTGVTITGLSASTAYDVQVVEANPYGTGPAATLLNVSTGAPGTAPSAVGSLAAGAPTSSTIPVTYTAATGTAPITYAGSTAPHGTTTWTANAGTFTSTGGTFTGLTAATNYDLRIAATNTTGTTYTLLTAGVTTATAGRTLPSVAAAAPLVWFDASRSNTVFSDAALTTQAAQTQGVAVQGLKDALGSTRALLQATSASAPVYDLAKANGKNMLAFNGGQVLLTPTAQAWLAVFGNGQPWTMRLVYQVTNPSNQQGVLSVLPDNASNFNPGLNLYAEGGHLSEAYFVPSGSKGVNTGTTAANTPVVVVLRYNGTYLLSNTATGQGSTNNVAVNTADTGGLSQLSIGQLPRLAKMIGGFGELAIWPGVATDPETDAMIVDGRTWWIN